MTARPSQSAISFNAINNHAETSCQQSNKRFWKDLENLMWEIVINQCSTVTINKDSINSDKHLLILPRGWQIVYTYRWHTKNRAFLC